MDQEYQALVVLDLLTTQMNKYANNNLMGVNSMN